MTRMIQDKIEKFMEVSELQLDPLFPPKIQFEVTNACNQDCVFCYRSQSPRGRVNITEKTVDMVLKQGKELGVSTISFTAGAEPLMHPQLLTFVRRAKLYYRYPYVFITTNGVAKPFRWTELVEAGLDSIKFSINAIDRENYELVHGADHFKLVMAAIEHLIKLKSEYKFYLGISFVECPENAHVALKAYGFWKPYLDRGLDEFFTVPASNQSGQMRAYPSIGMNQCNQPWLAFVVTADGYYRACCADMDNKTALCDLNGGIKKAFYSRKAKAFRKKHINHKLKGTICYDCLNHD